MKKSSLKTFTPNAKELPSAPKLPFVVSSDLRAYLSRLGLLRPFVAIVLVIVLMMRNFQYGLTVAITVAATLIIVFVLVRTRQVMLQPDRFIYRGAFGRKVAVAYGDIKEAHVFVNFADAGFGLTPRVILEKTDGSRLVSFNLLYWSPEDVDLMLAAFRKKNIKTTYYGDVVSSGMLTDHFARLLSPVEKHPYVTACLIVLGILVAVAAFVLLTMPR